MTVGRLPSIEGGIQPTIVDAKGDLITAVAADTPARIAVGANNTVLTADSSTATGLKWAAPASTAPALVAPVSGSFIKNLTTQTYSQDVPTLNVTYYIPVYLPTTSFDRIGLRTGVSHSGTSTNRLGLYNVDSVTGRPSTVVFDAGTVSATAANTDYQITISQSITAGYYYWAINQQSQSGSTNIQLVSQLLSPSIGIGDTFQGNGVNQGFQQTGVTGAFATAGTLTSGSNMWLLGMRMV